MSESNSGNITPEKFVKIWQRAKNREEVAEKTGLKMDAIAARVQKYRKNGVKLKHMRGRKKLDTAALNAIVDKIAEETKEDNSNGSDR